MSKISQRMEKLKELATNLARSNSDDDECVRLLREAATAHTHDLEVAAEEVLDFVGPESRVSDRANRLLVAAWSGQPVEPSPLGDEVFRRIEALYSTPVEAAYPTLVELQPHLEELNRRFAPRLIDEDAKDSVWDELRAALAPPIGPDAGADVTDPLLRTKAAHHIARLFLALRVGRFELSHRELTIDSDAHSA